MRTIAALALALAVTMVLYRSAEAAEARIESFAFVCETADGQTLKPRHGDVAGVVFADLPAQREQCLETIDFKIALCRENRDFGSGIDGGTHGACQPVFEQQAKACIGHFTFERDKCDASGSGAEEAAPEPAYTVDPLDTVMEAVERANLRDGPGTEHAVVGTLDVGASVRVTGTVETGTVETGTAQGRDWLRVELPEDGGAAFVYAPLLKEVLTAASLGPDWIATENDACLMHNPRPQPDETATWSGACVDDRVSGEGRAVWRHGGGTETYEGRMEAGKRHGQGTFVSAQGDRYEGAWRDGTMDGSGTYTWSSGDRYEGSSRNGTFHGRGTYAWADGSRYKGEWQDGKAHGYGTNVWPGRGYYEGEWQGGKAHGQGIFTDNGGTAFEGRWRSGCFEDRERYEDWVGATTPGSCAAE